MIESGEKPEMKTYYVSIDLIRIKEISSKRSERLKSTQTNSAKDQLEYNQVALCGISDEPHWPSKRRVHNLELISRAAFTYSQSHTQKQFVA